MPENDQHNREPDREPAREPDQDERTGRSAAAARMQHQARWVDLQIQEAMARGDFDDLPGYGKPIRDLGSEHDPDWWLKKLVEREQVTGVLPPALALRKEDAELDGRLDALNVEAEVRREVEDFNARVIRARYTPVDGPPLITQPRDVEAAVAAWGRRRAERMAAARAAAIRAGSESHREPRTPGRPRRRWWPGRRSRGAD